MLTVTGFSLTGVDCCLVVGVFVLLECSTVVEVGGDFLVVLERVAGFC